LEKPNYQAQETDKTDKTEGKDSHKGRGARASGSHVKE
jgi:hypothetical protein